MTTRTQPFRPDSLNISSRILRPSINTYKSCLDGEKALAEGLVKLSNQMAEYDKALHQRLDRIEDKIDRIHDLACENLYFRVGSCANTRQQIVEALNGTSDTAGFERVQTIANTVNYGAEIQPCIKYLSDLFYLAFDPSSRGFPAARVLV